MNIFKHTPTIDYGTPVRERAQHYARFLRDKLNENPGSEQARYLQIEQLRLVQGKHNLYPGVTLTCEEVGIDKKYRNMKIPTTDGATHMNIQRIEIKDGIVTRVPTKDKKTLTPEGIERIFAALKDVARRITPLEQQAFKALTQEPPRALNPQEAYSAAQRAYLMQQAKVNQRRAHEAGFAPQHPDDAAKEAKEQTDALRDDPHRTHDARHPRHGIAQTGHLTFGDSKTLSRNLKQNSMPRALRDHEGALMASMLKTISEGTKL